MSVLLILLEGRDESGDSEGVGKMAIKKKDKKIMN